MFERLSGTTNPWPPRSPDPHRTPAGDDASAGNALGTGSGQTETFTRPEETVLADIAAQAPCRSTLERYQTAGDAIFECWIHGTLDMLYSWPANSPKNLRLFCSSNSISG